MGAFETMAYSWEFLIAAFGPLGPFFVLGVFGTVLVAMSVPILLRKPVDPLDKLNTRGVRGPIRAPGGAEKNDTVRLRYDSGTVNLDKFAGFLQPKDKDELGATRLKLVQAGYRGRSAVSTFHLARFLLGIGFLLFGVLSVFMRNDDPGINTIVMSVVLPAVAGYYLPSYWVNRRIQTRQEEITNGFPDALDLMLVCVEAGQSLDQAILRVATEIQLSYPALAEEFEIVSNEMRAGKDRVTVLRDMGERCGVNDVSSFVTVLVQSATFGTSISDALRVYGSEMRDKRVMRAEEKANVLPTKLTVGTMLFTVPPLLIILVGPSMFDIYRNLLGGQ